MPVTINVRDVSDAVIAGIESAAQSAGVKSREAYLRSHLERTFAADSNPTFAISQRFRQALTHVINLGKSYALQPAPSIALVARELGHIDTAQLDAAYRGDVPLPFSDADRFCELFGVDRDWLDTGAATPFGQRAKHHSPVDLFRESYRDGIECERLFFVLQNAARGTVAVFGKRSDYRYDLLLADAPVHDDVGGTGAQYLMDLALFLAAKELPHSHVFDRSRNVVTSGRLLAPDEFSALVSGSVHPAKYLDYRQGSSNWHEDLWDLEYPGPDYSENYSRARELFRQNIGLDNVTTNAQLRQYIRSRYLKHWQIHDMELITTLRAQDPLEGDASYEAHDAFIKRAKSGKDGPERATLLKLFDNNRKPLPFWLDSRMQDE